MKSKVNMPSDLSAKCHAIIHTASVAAGAAGTIPIPMGETVPICAIQSAMIVSLGKVFDLVISQSVAKACRGVGLAKLVGQTVFSSFLKLIPGVGSVAGAVTAATVTETLGWIVADDFFRISVGREPENLVSAVEDIVEFRRRHFPKINRLTTIGM